MTQGSKASTEKTLPSACPTQALALCPAVCCQSFLLDHSGSGACEGQGKGGAKKLGSRL